MKVSELIAILSWMPKDYDVVVGNVGNERITRCFVNDEFYDGDSANPDCKIISVVELE